MTADPSDMATELEELHLQVSLANQRAVLRMKPKGICYYCSEPVSVGAMFCDTDCCQWYEDVEAAKKRNGR